MIRLVNRLPIVAIGLAGAAIAGIAAARGGSFDVQPLPQTFCSPVVHGAAKPQYLVVSDFPVRFFDNPNGTLQFQAAIRYELKRRGFRAGKYSVGYQACDDSSPQRGFGAFAKCASNAKAYAQNTSVIGVIGTWNSGCSAVELPILNRAPAGPLGLISPSNTNVGLTHAGGGTEPGEPGRYYPTGKRNFVRLISPDDAQGVADALLAKQTGAKSVFVLDDGDGYGLNVSSAFRRTAGRIGLKVVGASSWKFTQTSFERLARRVSRVSPDAVFLSGSACPGCGELIKALRGALGPKARIIGPDGFSAFEELAKAAGPAAEGIYVSIPGLPLSKLPSAGQKIERLFGPPHAGSGGPSYAAQAVAVLLDAIAASDGTRAAVAAHLLKTRIRHGIIGSFSFNRNGDTTFNPSMIFRISGGKGRLDRVITPPAAFLR